MLILALLCIYFLTALIDKIAVLAFFVGYLVCMLYSAPPQKKIGRPL